MPAEARSPDFVRPSFADPNSGRIVVLADDLTGACDAGAPFLRVGPLRSRLVRLERAVFRAGIRAGIQHQIPLALASPRNAHWERAPSSSLQPSLQPAASSGTASSK